MTSETVGNRGEPPERVGRASADHEVLVSVVIDNYNYARYVGDAIESALRQTWHHTEVVVVDDGSTDESREVIDRYNGSIRVLFKENGGQGSAFNAGFAHARGDVVIFVDSDDVMLPDFAERAVAALASAPEATLVQFRMRTVDEHLVPLGATVPPSYVELSHGDVAARVRRWLTGSSFAPNGAVAFRRWALEQLFPLEESKLRQGADFYMVRGCALIGPVTAVDDVAVDYRSHGSNDSNLATLHLPGLRRALHRQILYGEVLAELTGRLGDAAPIMHPLAAPDPLFLTQRMVSLRLEPHAHPFTGDTRLRLASAGVRAAVTRDDVRPALRILHAAWFLLVACSPRPAARMLATWLMLPLSRASATSQLSAGARRVVARVRRRVS